jgi:hypothetical protein
VVLEKKRKEKEKTSNKEMLRTNFGPEEDD